MADVRASSNLSCTTGGARATCCEPRGTQLLDCRRQSRSFSMSSLLHAVACSENSCEKIFCHSSARISGVDTTCPPRSFDGANANFCDFLIHSSCQLPDNTHVAIHCFFSASSSVRLSAHALKAAAPACLACRPALPSCCLTSSKWTRHNDICTQKAGARFTANSRNA